MIKKEDFFKKVISHAREYGFIFQSSEIYDGLSAVYDYGPRGVALKNNIRDYWWKAMVQLHENIVGIDAAILMHPTTWKASGHVDAFNDPLVDNKESKKRYRADQLIEGYCEKIEKKIEREKTKAKKRFGKAFNEAEFLNTNPRVLKYREEINGILNRMNAALKEEDMQALGDLISELQIADPETGSRNWTEVKQFNLMFSTRLGAARATNIYLRPETAQGIFVNFLNVQKSARQKIPFGIAQTGKAFRNEIVARQFIFRMREFEQMEMQFFIKPGTEDEWYEKWKERRMLWHLGLGLGEESYRFHDHDNLAHYAKAATDIEFKFPFGFRELEGIHSRSDFDLKAHETHSGRKMLYFDPELKERYLPYVVETSIGLDRMFLAVFSGCLKEESLPDGSQRIVMNIPAALAPTKVAVLPLVKRDGLPELARRIFNDLKLVTAAEYDEKDAVGRRYRRQDAVGTPYCVTIDHQSLEDEAVTLRDRDSMKQERVAIDRIKDLVVQKTDLASWLKKLAIKN